MFDHTAAVLISILNGFKKIAFSIGIMLQLTIILHLGYSIYSQKGSVIANAVLLTISVLYLIFTVATRNMNEKEMKTKKKIVKRAVKYSKMLVQATTLGILIYGITISSVSFTAMDLILIALSLAAWVMQFIIQIATQYIESKVDLISLAFKADFGAITRPVSAVGDAIRKISGAPANIPEDEPKESSAKKKLDKIYGSYVEEKRAKKEQKRANRAALYNVFKTKRKNKNKNTAQIAAPDKTADKEVSKVN